MNHTPGPWDWVIHDHSMASLGRLPDPGLGDPLVLAVGPCPACAGRADPREWKWGLCDTPSEADAILIAAAPEMLAALQEIIARNEIQHWFNLDLARAAVAKATEAAGDTALIETGGNKNGAI